MATYHLFPDVRRYATVSPQVQPVAGHRIVFGLILGQGEFHGCTAIIDATVHQLVKITRFVRTDYGAIRDRLCRLNWTWKPQAIYTESSSLAGPDIEALQTVGLPIYPVTVTSKTKDRLLQNLALALVDERFTMVPDEGLITELQAYSFEMKESRSSNTLPPHIKGDSVAATALAMYGSDHGGTSIRFA